MPLYDFHCADCTGEREVLIPFDQADSLELTCVDCGGPMNRGLTTSFTVLVGASERGTPSPTGKPHRQGHTCSTGAVRLTRKNPFANALPGNAEHQAGGRKS